MFQVANKSQTARWTAAALTAVLFGASAGLSQATEPSPPPAKKLTFRDIQLTVFVRKALADDPVVGPVNLGVRVQDNVAVLWGPAPSEAVRRRAVELTKKAPGVFEVRDADVYIAAPAPPAPTPVPLPPPPETPTLIESDSPQAPTGKSDAAPAAPAVDSPPAPTVVLRPPTPATDGPPAQLVSAASLDDLAAAVARVRLAEERFHAVNYHMDGDAVVLYMGAGRAEEVMAFARSIAHLPGLVRIEVVGADGTGPR